MTTTRSTLKPVKLLKSVESNQAVIEQNTLLEELYTFYSLSRLHDMMVNEPDNTLLQNWRVSPEELQENVELAIDYVKND